jgi:hypothetical protein
MLCELKILLIEAMKLRERNIVHVLIKGKVKEPSELINTESRFE